MDIEKRMAGDYEIIQAIKIDDREIVVGENQNSEKGQKYMTAFCEQYDVLALHSEVLMSDDYPEIMKLFGERITVQAEKTRIELSKPCSQGIDITPITAEGCSIISYDDDLNNKVIVIKPEVLRREFRRATNQIKLCEGGFSASPNSRGSAVYCVDLYSGNKARFERHDVLGTLMLDQLPDWAKQGYDQYQQGTLMNKYDKEKEDR